MENERAFPLAYVFQTNSQALTYPKIQKTTQNHQQAGFKTPTTQTQEFSEPVSTTTTNRDSNEYALMNRGDVSTSLCLSDESWNFKNHKKRRTTWDSPVSCNLRKNPRIIAEMSILSPIDSTSRVAPINYESTENAANEFAEVSSALCLFDKSWDYCSKRRKTTENSALSCVPRKVLSTEVVNISKLRTHTEKQKEEEIRLGVSTQLRLFTDPWTIKKNLTNSDLGNLSRLLIGVDLVTKHILKFLPHRSIEKIKSKEEVPVWVWDDDTNSLHRLKFKRWETSKSYVLIGDWRKDFVKRRTLNEGDKIGLFWDPYKFIFHFCVLQRAAAASARL